MCFRCSSDDVLRAVRHERQDVRERQVHPPHEALVALVREVRRGDQAALRDAAQRVVDREGLHLVDVQAGPEAPLDEHPRERRLVQDGPSGAVDDDGVGSEKLQQPLPDQAPCLLSGTRKRWFMKWWFRNGSQINTSNYCREYLAQTWLASRPVTHTYSESRQP